MAHSCNITCSLSLSLCMLFSSLSPFSMPLSLSPPSPFSTPLSLLPLPSLRLSLFPLSLLYASISLSFLSLLYASLLPLFLFYASLYPSSSFQVGLISQVEQTRGQGRCLAALMTLLGIPSQFTSFPSPFCLSLSLSFPNSLSPLSFNPSLSLSTFLSLSLP